ncbi:suppressor of Mek1-like [Cydia amplana]|uniref:suppressor of Mek1-like n=1 Tax=Cydia amplana TaxID=1869771 RepID=UPI002FE56F22
MEIAMTYAELQKNSLERDRPRPSYDLTTQTGRETVYNLQITTVEVVCNLSSQPKGGEKVYETKWSDGEGWTTCGCPDGFVEDDCLCVPGRNPDNKNDTQSEDKDGQQNKDKDDQKNKDKDDQQNTDKNDQQNTDKNDQQNTDKNDQQNKDKDDQQNKDKDDQENKDKNDQQNTDKNDQQNTDKNDQQNTDKNYQQNTDKNDQQNTDKNDQQNTDKDDQQKKDTCDPGDPSCPPRVVIMPIFTVENVDPDRLNEAQMMAWPKDLEQQKQQLRRIIKNRIQNVRDRYFKDYVVLEPGTRFSNGGPIDEDNFVLSRNHPNYMPNMNRKGLNNFGTNTKTTNIEIKDRRDFSDLDQLVSEYLLNLHDDEAMDSTADMTDKAVHHMRENNINGKQANTQHYRNPSTPNLQDDTQGYRKAISNFDYAIEDHLNTGYEPRTMDQRNIYPDREQNPLNIQAVDTNNYGYQLYSENNQGYGNVDPQYVVEDYTGFQNDEKSDEQGRGQNRQLIYNANEITHYYLDRLNEDTNAGQRLDTETLNGYRVDTDTDTKHRHEHRRPLYLDEKSSEFQRHTQNDGGVMKDHKPRYFVPDRASLQHG